MRRQNSDATETKLTLQFGFRPVRLPGRERALSLLMIKAAKRLFGVPDFRFYAIVDGMREILAGRHRPLFPSGPAPPEPSLQLELFTGADP